MILYHSADLIWATKIKAAADALGLPARPVRTLEMLEARLADSPVRALLVDLADPDTALALIRRLRAGPPTSPGVGSIHILAYGPHVEVEAMADAKAAGADTVMPRGGLNARLTETLARLGGVTP